MKKNIITTLLFVFGFCIKAQQQELTENMWYLTKIVEEGIEYYTPEPWENFTEARLEFLEYEGQYQLIASICLHEVLMDVTLLSNVNFSCEYIFDTMMECAPYIPYYQEYEQRYTGFWRSFPEGASNPFSYEILNEDGILKLVITNGFGNQSFYQNIQLSIEENTKNNLSFYPNPVKDKLTIENPDFKTYTVRIGDVTGKIVMTVKISSKQTAIDLGNLHKGIYFLIFEENGKIIKKEKLLKK